MTAKKDLPLELEEDLKRRPKYKAPPAEEVLDSMLRERGVEPAADEFSFERGLLDDILGTGGRQGKGGGGLVLNSRLNRDPLARGSKPAVKIYSGRSGGGGGVQSQQPAWVSDQNARPGSSGGGARRAGPRARGRAPTTV